MRNYRIVTKQNNLSAWGGGRSQMASPIRDSIKLILPLKLKLNDNHGLDFVDSVGIDFVKPTLNFKLNDNHGNFATDAVSLPEPVIVITVNDSNTLNVEDDGTYE